MKTNTKAPLRPLAALQPQSAGLSPADISGRENIAHGPFLSALVATLGEIQATDRGAPCRCQNEQ